MKDEEYKAKKKTIAERIIDRIGSGKGNAVNMAAVAREYGIDDRTVRRIIYNARIHGTVIIGDKNGYYKPSKNDIAELKRFCNSKRKSAMGALKIWKQGNDLLAAWENENDLKRWKQESK